MESTADTPNLHPSESEPDEAPQPDPDFIREMLGKLLAPWRWITSPVFYGMENIPEERGALFVSNHTLMGMLDVPLLLFELLDKRGLLLRSLGDRLHYETLPSFWGDVCSSVGVVLGTPEGCARLMRAGESILVFPGGGREVCKRKGEKYGLVWKERTGFARMAIEHGYPIIPVSAIGADDCFDILIDANDILNTPLRGPIERLGLREDLIPPLIRGVGLSVWPRPERFYFRFGEVIETAQYEGRSDDPEALCAVRDQTRAAVEEGIEWLLAEREHDPGRDLVGRLRRRFWPLRG